ncbi:MAG TPA: ABC transporter substrate-binding protein [Bradyrhizobium sp.]|jgi:putative ABC transport system substrate-binding protein|nr:ABC transporter substrate-binding protein [Bradyrhizobium sp.]
MQRRDFITLVGGAAAAVMWPVSARAQQADRMRLVGSLNILAEDDPESRSRIAMFKQSLKELGWTEGGNVRIEARWAGGDDGLLRKYAAELAALTPDVILTSGSVTVRPVQQATRTVPIVFVQVVDPVGSGYVDSLSRPGGHTTGFTLFEYSLSGKWLELLKEIAPKVTRVAVIRDPTRGSGIAQFAAMQTAAPSLGMELSTINASDVHDMERGIAAFARSTNGGLIVTSGGTGFHRDAIIPLAARLRLPAVYPYRYYATDGGLVAYGPNTIDQYRRAAKYVDRILKGEKPADLPVQAPTKYELVINLKTAKALGLEVPSSLLARADEVLE